MYARLLASFTVCLALVLPSNVAEGNGRGRSNSRPKPSYKLAVEMRSPTRPSARLTARFNARGFGYTISGAVLRTKLSGPLHHYIVGKSLVVQTHLGAVFSLAVPQFGLTVRVADLPKKGLLTGIYEQAVFPRPNGSKKSVERTLRIMQHRVLQTPLIDPRFRETLARKIRADETGIFKEASSSIHVQRTHRGVEMQLGRTLSLGEWSENLELHGPKAHWTLNILPSLELDE